ncbi:MAG: alpha/beta fold hydrolase [Litoreibacter sp.]|uniref:alpha/beta hydrolase family esterase n=1 Tax=Litoreibacter sp. TaxID=1969459 RepID=UPI00329A2DF3
MIRLLALLGAISFSGSPALSDTVLGRNYVVVDGRKDTNRPAPLVIAIHGFLGNASNMQRKTGFDRLAKRHGFIVAYPNGRLRRWNDGRSSRNKTDDVAFLSAMIAKMVTSGQVRSGRVFVAGHSNGGGMAMRMACDRPDLVRGISVVATKTSTNYQCRQGPPVPAIFMHGTADPIAPHAGRPEGSRLGGTLSAEATLDLWKVRNRCTGAPRSRTFDKKNDGTSVKVTRHTNCRAALNYVLIDGHGHDWPSLNGKATRLQGPASNEVGASALSWAFFSQL